MFWIQYVLLDQVGVYYGVEVVVIDDVVDVVVDVVIYLVCGDGVEVVVVVVCLVWCIYGQQVGGNGK